MSYPERKKYRAMKTAKQYMKRSYLFDALVVLGGINILGSFTSIFISLPYFVLSLVFSIAVMAVGYKASSYFEAKAISTIKSIDIVPIHRLNTTKKPKRNNIIKVDFRNKRVDGNSRCSGM
ncbi:MULTISPECIES: hypothetical protein [unclassified Ruminococcus]|uniref:hypothetical protein n=1 Tax=unclassified Ruminococcus TaxID=2608920 RepID=UPI00210C2E32|nr:MULTISPECIES: hypothetical protein [unclassified Ruminococcus]MCQ4023282.1 hypothetical protein [Ruminococcus sp. zg-924]MCQ4115625.1 hypothetical protein [Ruminococcus sp. zg-921]